MLGSLRAVSATAVATPATKTEAPANTPQNQPLA